jgi:molybdopterin-synthase adenylyltransferase
MTGKHDSASRYARQTAFEELGQSSLARGHVLIVGVGGLGSWAAELLARAGVGFLRLVDDDRVETANLQRQSLYDEDDANGRSFKVDAAARRLARVNGRCEIEPVPRRADRFNIDRLLGDVDVAIDGTDNFATRFVLNDACLAAGRPWIFAGVVRCEAQAAVIVPGRTACLRCLLPDVPPACVDPNCRQAGVMGMAVAAVAAFQAMEAVKLLAGRLDAVNPHLVKFDLWANTVQRIRVMGPQLAFSCSHAVRVVPPAVCHCLPRTDVRDSSSDGAARDSAIMPRPPASSVATRIQRQ